MFEVGHIYNRRRHLHDVYGGQRQSGIVTPRGHPMVLLFTSDQGEAHGYEDGYRDDGSFWYTGEGQKGNMTFVRGNKAIRDHIHDGKSLCLFRDQGGGEVKHEGEFRLLGYHSEQRPDTDGQIRNAIVFELEPMAGAEETDDEESISIPSTKTM